VGLSHSGRRRTGHDLAGGLPRQAGFRRWPGLASSPCGVRGMEESRRRDEVEEGMVPCIVRAYSPLVLLGDQRRSALVIRSAPEFLVGFARRSSQPMPSRKKIDLQKVLASLNTTCPKCGRVIEPQEIRRVNFKLKNCPGYGERFDAKKPRPE
jgi:hypothetical protein